MAARAPRRAAVLALAALLIAACGPPPPEAPEPRAPAPSPAPTAAPSPSPAPTPTAAPVAAPTHTPSPAPTPAPPALTVAAVGDLMFARDVTTLMETHGPGYPFERVAELLAGSDLLIGNLEGTFTARGRPLDKTYTFRTPPPLAAALREAGFGAVSLANNHALDFGAEGLADTLAALDAEGVARFGAGFGRREAERPLVLRTGGARVALLGFSAAADSVFAGWTRPGVAGARAGAVAAAVALAAADADFVIAFFHFGREYDPEPTERQRELARAAADADADLVIGCHAHVLQPWERRGGALILYGLGNFVFDLDRDDLATLGEGPFATAVAVVALGGGAPPRVEFRPAYIDPVENRPRPAAAGEAARILGALRELGGD